MHTYIAYVVYDMFFEYWNAVHPFCSFTFLQRSMVCLGLPLLPLTSRNSLGTKSCWSKYRNSTCEMSTVAPCISGHGEHIPGFNQDDFFFLGGFVFRDKRLVQFVQSDIRKHEIFMNNRILSSWLVSSGQVSMSRITNSMIPEVFIDLSVLWNAWFFSTDMYIHLSANYESPSWISGDHPSRGYL